MLFIIPIAALMLCLPRAVISYRIHVTGTVGYAFVRVRLFCGLVNKCVRIRFSVTQSEGLSLMRIYPSGRRKNLLTAKPPSPFKDKIKRALLSSLTKGTLDLKKSHMRLRIGTGNPRADVLLCAAAYEIYRILSGAVYGKCKPDVTSSVCPDFSRCIFILKMEGILYADHVKIIFVTIKALLRRSS